jgi:aminopeptidase YwaD
MDSRVVLRLSAAALCAALTLTSSRAQSVQPLPATSERAYRAMSTRFDEQEALSVVSFMDRYWRLAGNPGYNASIDAIRTRLIAAGYADGASVTSPHVRVEEFPNTSRGWDYREGAVVFEGERDALLSRERDRVSLAINSFSTTGDGLVAPLVDVGRGRPTDYAGKDLKGAVVLGDAAIGRLWQDAVTRGGAAGVISTEIASYIRPADPAQMSDEQKDVLQWGAIPYDATAKGFGFKSSWRAANRMRERLAQRGNARVRVTIDSAFYDGPNRTLIAEIPGRSHPEERIVLVAHVQEPGANDNGSGCGTLYGLARALATAIKAGELPPPDRTLTFMWLDEVRGSRQWIAAHPVDARHVQYMFAMDMTGENVARTGGSFLIEKQADPTAVWSRPSDPHTEWGAGSVEEQSLKGSLLNDLHLAVCFRRAVDAMWTVRTNPYEGGSDHTAFASEGTPSLLNWHFTDRYYHSNQDRLDKVSPAEMKNVGVAVATSAWTLASADTADARAVLRIVLDAAQKRLELERVQGGTAVANAADKAAATATEQRIGAAWVRWYGEALDSIERLPVNGADIALRRDIEAARVSLASAPTR